MTQPREDGPALQRLFAQIDGPSIKEAPMPESFAAQIGAGRAATAAALDLRAIEGDAPVDGPLHGVPIESLGRDAEGEGVNTDGDPEEQKLSEPMGIVNYPHALHQAGEAAIQIVTNMVDSEFAQGNPRNIPEPILGWYTMTMGYQLCMLEATEQSFAARKDHAEQLGHAIKIFSRNEGAYPDLVREEVAFLLANRFRPAALQDEDRTYGGVLA